MFYSQDILQRRGGKFGIIWLAATKAIPLTRRSYAQVHIKKTCNDIIHYICLQAQPVLPGGARPRLSLYLSSQLMYGLIVVFNKHHDYLLRDTTDLSKRFWSMASAVDIDLRAPPKADLVTLNMTLACSPEFGMLRSLELSPAKLDFPEAEYLQFSIPPKRELSVSAGSGAEAGGASSDFSSPKPSKKAKHPFTPVLGLQNQATPEQITIADDQPHRHDAEPMMMGEQDLPPMDIQLLNDAMDDPFQVNVSPIRPRFSDSKSILEETLSNLARVVILPDVQRTEELDDLGMFSDLDAALAPADTTPQLPGPGGDSDMPPQPPHKRAYKEVTDGDITLLPTQHRAKTHKKPKKRRESFSLTLDPVEGGSPLKHRRLHRRLDFQVDEVTQISREAIKQQIEAGDSTTRNMELAGQPMRTVADMFSCPARKGLTEKVCRKWHGHAYTDYKTETPELQQLCWSVPQLGASSSSSDSDLELQRIQAEDAITPPALQDDQETSPTALPPPEQPPTAEDILPPLEHMLGMETGMETGMEGAVEGLSRLMESVEHARDMSLDKTGQMDSISRSHLDSSDNDSLQRGGGGGGRETPVHDDPAPGETSLGVLTEVPEEHLEEMQAASPTVQQDPATHAHLTLLQHASRGRCIFRDVFPPRYTKAKVAVAGFTALLEMVAQRKLRVHQEAPYEDIVITVRVN